MYTFKFVYTNRATLEDVVVTQSFTFGDNEQSMIEVWQYATAWGLCCDEFLVLNSVELLAC